MAESASEGPWLVTVTVYSTKLWLPVELFCANAVVKVLAPGAATTEGAV